MRITSDRLRILLDQGLSEYQARVYLSLLEYPALPAGPLAKASRVPRNRLYEVLEDLQSLGLAEILIDESTRRYRAQPLAAYLDQRTERLREGIAEIEAQKEVLASEFQPPEPTTAADLDVGTTRAVVGRRAVAREVSRIVESARESLVAVASAGGSTRVVRYLSAHLNELVSREEDGLEVEVFLPHAAEGLSVLPRLGPLVPRVKWVDFALGTMVFAVDEREVLMVHPIPDDEHVHTGRDFALLSTDAALARDQIELVRRAARATLALGADG